MQTHRVHLRLATADSFKVSSDGRWIAWEQSGGGSSATSTVGVVSITGRECLLVPGPDNKGDSLPFFKPGVKRLFFLREPSGSVASGHIVSVPLSSLRRAPTSACKR